MQFRVRTHILMALDLSGFNMSLKKKHEIAYRGHRKYLLRVNQPRGFLLLRDLTAYGSQENIKEARPKP